MKKLTRFTALVLAAVCVFSAIGITACADHQSGSEKFEGVSRQEKDVQKLQEIYDDLIYRIYQFDPDIMLPNFEDMNDLDDICIKYVQAQRGTARGQKLYTEPDGDVRWYAKDGCKVKVYARYKDYSLVELMMNDKESEGTIAWMPTTYVVNKWSAKISSDRTRAARGW